MRRREGKTAAERQRDRMLRIWEGGGRRICVILDPETARHLDDVRYVTAESATAAVRRAIRALPVSVPEDAA